ncbi:MAG: hypothetical protein ACRDIC_22500 [bacterium]
MRRWFSWHGLIAGLAAGAALVFVLVAGWLTDGMPIVAGALSERARGLLPLRVLGWFIVTFKFDAKPLGYWITIATVVAVCAVAGSLFGARRPRLWAAVLPAAGFIAAVLALTAARPSIGYLSARLGAEGVSNAEAQALTTIALAMAGYAIVGGGVFGVVLGLLALGRAPGRVAPAAPAGLDPRGRNR